MASAERVWRERRRREKVEARSHLEGWKPGSLLSVPHLGRLGSTRCLPVSNAGDMPPRSWGRFQAAGSEESQSCSPAHMNTPACMHAHVTAVLVTLLLLRRNVTLR